MADITTTVTSCGRDRINYNYCYQREVLGAKYTIQTRIIMRPCSFEIAKFMKLPVRFGSVRFPVRPVPVPPVSVPIPVLPVPVLPVPVNKTKNNKTNKWMFDSKSSPNDGQIMAK